MAVLELYKKDQGKYVRWGTVAGIALLTCMGMYWLGYEVLGRIEAITIGSLVINPIYIKTFFVIIWGLVGAWIALLAANRPRSAEFLIMTESEMRKVNWPSRREVWVNTKVVIFLTLAFACLLAAVDWGFIKLFDVIGILSGT